MTVLARRRAPARTALLDKWLEAVPVFRLSDSAEDGALAFIGDDQTRWRVLPAPGERLPGTFDQDVYVELMHRYQEAGAPSDGVVTFTLHAFLRSMGRRVDGRTYEQLRAALNRLQRTSLESTGGYWDASANVGEGAPLDGTLAILASVAIDRRRSADREQLALFDAFSAPEPGDARVTIAPALRANISAGHTSMLSVARWTALASPVVRRLYRLLEVARAEGSVAWRIPLDRLALQIPLTQRYPSHLHRVLQPAHEMLLADGLVRDAAVRQVRREWFVDYVLASRVSALGARE